MKYTVENVAIVQYFPKYASARIAPISGVKEQVPCHAVTLLAAEALPSCNFFFK